MTLAEVIDTLQTWIRNADDEYDREEMGRVAGLKEALHEIKKIETCEDAISRDELLKAMDTWDKFGYTETGCFVREPKNDCVKYIHYDDVIECIKCMPSVKPQEPKTGHWMFKQRGKNIDICCSECGYTRIKEYAYNYSVKDLEQSNAMRDFLADNSLNLCENCGAKMEVEK